MRRRRANVVGGLVEWLIVGLGNPGRRYAGTRHNVGFEVVSMLSARWGMPRAKKKFAGLLTVGQAGPLPVEVALLLPQTFMNESGRSVGPAAGAYHVAPQRVLVVHDEIDLPFGEVRGRLGGGLAGHNGLKSLAAALGSPDFRRLRLGIGRPDSTDTSAVSNYVLSRFSEPKDEVASLLERACYLIEELLTSEYDGLDG